MSTSMPLRQPPNPTYLERGRTDCNPVVTLGLNRRLTHSTHALGQVCKLLYIQKSTQAFRILQDFQI
jgi:hypothetical protein